LEKEKPPILGMIQRGGDVVIKMLENVKSKKISPFIDYFIEKNTMIYTDEYDIYNYLESGV